jgi:heme A synthase
MRLLAPRGEADELTRFRRLVTSTIVATFSLIVIGGVVRVSDSGLGCGAAHSGTQGWPLCSGRPLPFLETHAVIEFSHRLAATVVVVLIAALVVLSVRRLRDRTWLVRGSIAAAVLVLAQAVLGGLTVEHGLAEYLVAAHLGLAMLLLGLLLALRRAADATESTSPAGRSGALRISAVTATVLVFATIVAGGLIAGTEREGTGANVGNGAHLACGEEFPTCNDSVLPFGTGRLVDIQLTHRVAMVLAAVAVLTMAGIALRSGVPGRAFRLAPLLLVCQILLGASNVWLGEHPGLVVAHLALGTLLWATVVYAAVSLLTIPAPARGRVSHSDAEVETAGAAA